jgi:CheY-like chemotaxis protein
MVQKHGFRGAHAWQAIVADDDEDWRALVARTLRRAGLQVLEARDGDEVLAYHRAVQGSKGRRLVIVSDLDMPTYDGIAAVGALRQVSDQTPILVVTGVADESMHQRALKAGADVVLTKPVTPERLLEAMAGLLEGRTGSGSDGPAAT